MKKLFYSASMIGLLVSCGGSAEETTNTETKKDTVSQEPVVVEEPPVENSFVLESGTVGVFKIGQPFGKLPDELNSRKASIMLNENGEQVEHIQHIVFNSLEDVVEVTMEKNDAQAEEDLVIQEMRVISNYFETADGIKVGSLVSDLTTKYPDAKFFYSGSLGEIVAEVGAYTGIQFIIDPAGCTKKVSGSKDISLSAKSFNAEAKIATVRVY